MSARKTNIGIASLTPEQKITAAYMHDVLGFPQHHIAALWFVNPGRVAEAVKEIRAAVGKKGKEAA